MFENKKILLYPYSRDSYILVAHLIEKGYKREDIFVVAPGKGGIAGRDAGGCFNLPLLGITIENDVGAYKNKADILLVICSTQSEMILTKLKLHIEDFLQQGKEVICCRVLEESFLASVMRKTCPGQFIYLPSRWKVDIGNVRIEAGNFYRTKAPVILVGEMMGGLEIYDIVEQITRHFRKTGYQVAAVGDKNYSELLEINRMPDILSATELSGAEKISLLNLFIHEIEEKEKPDIIIIQLPGAIMKYSNNLTEAFGIIPFLLSQAVEADYMLLCVPYGTINNEFYEQLKNICLYRFNVELCGICMSNSMLDFQDTDNMSRRSYVNVSQKKLNEKIGEVLQKGDIPVYNCYEEGDCTEICDKLIELLKV